MKTLTQILLILLFILAGMTATYMYNELQTPVYQAETKIRIETRFPDGSVAKKYNNFHMDLARLQDHSRALLSENVLKEFIRDTGASFANLTSSDLQKITAAELNPDTMEISLKARHPNPAKAIVMANTIPVIYKKYFLDTDASIKSRVILTSPAKQPLEIAAPRVFVNLSAAFIASLILGFAFSIYLKKSQQKISTEQDVQNNFGLPVLGAIPKPR